MQIEFFSKQLMLPTSCTMHKGSILRLLLFHTSPLMNYDRVVDYQIIIIIMKRQLINSFTRKTGPQNYSHTDMHGINREVRQDSTKRKESKTMANIYMENYDGVNNDK